MAHPLSQHRSLQPTGPPTQGPAQSRLDSGLETIRQEFDTLTQELSMMRAQRDEYEAKSAYLPFSAHLLGPHLFFLTFAILSTKRISVPSIMSD